MLIVPAACAMLQRREAQELMSKQRPTIALAMGDPAGISPELTAKVLSLPDVRAAAQLIVIGDRRLLAAGARTGSVDPDVNTVSSVEQALSTSGKSAFLDVANCDPATITAGEISRAGGAAALQNFRAAIDLAKAGRVGAVCFTPFNKAAMRLAHPTYTDEIVFLDEVLGTRGTASEFNILDTVWMLG